MTLGLTPTLGLIGAIILIWLNMPFLLLLLLLFVLCLPPCLVSSSAGKRISANDSLHCWTLIVYLQGALGAVNSYLETWWQMSLRTVTMRHWFPGNCFAWTCTPPPPIFLFFTALSAMTSFLHLSISFTTMICGCPSVLLPHSVGVL